MALFLLGTVEDSATFEAGAAGPVIDEMQSQLRLGLSAHARAIESRLQRLGHGVLMLRAYAREVLSSPQIYGAQEGVADSSSGEGGSGVFVPLDNPLVYSSGEDGAMRKLFDDGGPAVFFRARPANAAFSSDDLQRLHATAALDPLLKEPTETDHLCAHA
ncbi:hypothetical protein IIA79_08750, partial [bacterium]|nr:hypothetical protein [bacterium]